MIKLLLFLYVLVIFSPGIVKGNRYSTCGASELVTVILSISNFTTLVILIIIAIRLWKERRLRRVVFDPSPKKLRLYEHTEEETVTVPSRTNYRSDQRSMITRNESVLSIISETNNEQSKEIPTENSPENTNQSVPKPKVEPIIKREQMDALVRDILLKSQRFHAKSLTDLNKLISEGNTGIQLEELMNGKTSNNEDDNNDDSLEQDQYDTLPSPVPLNESENNEPDLVYDVIPNNKEMKRTNIMITEQNYVLPISPSCESLDFNEYVNARLKSTPKQNEIKKREDKGRQTPIEEKSSKENNGK